MEKINLGTKPVNKISMFFGLIMYYLLRTKDGKNLEEFKNGMIKHKCEYDFAVYGYYEGHKNNHKCKHYGCNFITMKEENGEYINLFMRRMEREQKEYEANVL